MIQDYKRCVAAILASIFVVAGGMVIADEVSRNQARAKKQQTRSQRSQSEKPTPLAAAGWVRVAFDTDNDGKFDAVDSLYIDDIRLARENSARRADDDAKSASTPLQARRQTAQPSTTARIEEVRGQIVNLGEHQLAGTTEPIWMARVKTEKGRTAKVILGPKPQLTKLALKDGVVIAVAGVRGRINDRPVLIANKVTSAGSEVEVKLPDSRYVRRVRGDVEDLRSVRFRGFPEPHMVGEVELLSGRKVTVNFGPRSKVAPLKLKKGVAVAMLVRPGKVNGKPAMIAEQIHYNDETIQIPRPRDINRFAKRSW